LIRAQSMSHVFISYSDPKGRYASLRAELAKDLRSQNLSVWVDKDAIAVGDPWLERIDSGLGGCYAAIVLLSQDILLSDFAKYEISCLAHRSRSDSGFKLFGLMLDDFKLTDLDVGFFNSIRFANFQHGEFAEKRQAVIDALRALGAQDSTPTRELEDLLRQSFEQVPITTIGIVAREQQWTTWQGLPEPAQKLHFVRMLLAAPMATQLQVLNRTQRAFPPGTDVRQLFERLAPSWVDEAAALQLSDVRRRPLKARGAFIRGDVPGFTVGMFLQRARPAESFPATFPCSAPQGTNALKSLADAVRESLRGLYSVKSGDDTERIEAELNKKLDKLSAAGHVAIYVLQLEELELDVVAELQDRFPRVCFIVMSRQAAALTAQPALAERISLIAPELHNDAAQPHHNETYAFEWYTDRHTVLGTRP
jgi:hypothetical protein